MTQVGGTVDTFFDVPNTHTIVCGLRTEVHNLANSISQQVLSIAGAQLLPDSFAVSPLRSFRSLGNIARTFANEIIINLRHTQHYYDSNVISYCTRASALARQCWVGYFSMK